MKWKSSCGRHRCFLNVCISLNCVSVNIFFPFDFIFDCVENVSHKLLLVVQFSLFLYRTVKIRWKNEIERHRESMHTLLFSLLEFYAKSSSMCLFFFHFSSRWTRITSFFCYHSCRRKGTYLREWKKERCEINIMIITLHNIYRLERFALSSFCVFFWLLK